MTKIIPESHPPSLPPLKASATREIRGALPEGGQIPARFSFARMQGDLRVLAAAYAAHGANPAALDPQGSGVAEAPFPVHRLVDPLRLIAHASDTASNTYNKRHAFPMVAMWHHAGHLLLADRFRDDLHKIGVSVSVPGQEDPCHLSGHDTFWILGALCERALMPDNPLGITGAMRIRLETLNTTLTSFELWLTPESERAETLLHHVLGSHGLEPSLRPRPREELHPEIESLIIGLMLMERRGVFEALQSFQTHPLPEAAIRQWRPATRGDYEPGDPRHRDTALNGVPLTLAVPQRRQWAQTKRATFTARQEPVDLAPHVHAHPFEQSAYEVLDRLRSHILPRLTGQVDWEGVKTLLGAHSMQHFLNDQAPKTARHGDAKFAAHRYGPALHKALTDANDLQALNCFARVAETLMATTRTITPTGQPDREAEVQRAAIHAIYDSAESVLRLAPSRELESLSDMQRDRLKYDNDTTVLKHAPTAALGPRTHAELDAWGETLRGKGMGR